MVHKFSAKNFFSIKDTLEVSFEVNNNAPDNSGYIKDFNYRTSKIMATIGPNASGKTNVLKILSFLRYLIVDSFTDLKPSERIPLYPYAFVGRENNLPTVLSVTFSCGDSLYEYFISLNQDQIMDEKLRKYNKKTKQFYSLFKRVWDKEKKDYEYDLANFITSPQLKNVAEKRKNASLISTAAQLDHELSNEITAYWQTLHSNVALMGKHFHDEFMVEAAKFYFENPESKKMAEKLLTKFELGLTELRLDKHTLKSESSKEEFAFVPTGFHNVHGKNYPLPFLMESSGTKNLFFLLSKILPVLANGGIAVLDEFDADLHPHMLPELIDLFISNELNPKNAQLLFSTHHHEILNKLDKYQITLVEKNRETSTSEVLRLDEIEGVRADDNYYAKYIAGVYGGVPEL